MKKVIVLFWGEIILIKNNWQGGHHHSGDALGKKLENFPSVVHG